MRKLGERILPEIIPILQDGLDSEADEHREGVCVGLMEIISSSSKETVVMYCDILEPTLAKALLDPNGGVRRAAAEAFCMLDNVVGHKILDDILPVLFDKVVRLARVNYVFLWNIVRRTIVRFISSGQLAEMSVLQYCHSVYH